MFVEGGVFMVCLVLSCFFGIMVSILGMSSDTWKHVLILKISCLFSLCCLMKKFFFEGVIISADWMKISGMGGSMGFSFDLYFFFFFFFVASWVTWSIVEFAGFYMVGDPLFFGFFRCLLMFLLKMLVLTCSDSFLVFFVGWEGVGFFSFVLMGWWKSRKDGQSSAMQAMVYNRMGDLGILLILFFCLSFYNCWSVSDVYFFEKKNFIFFFGLLAAFSKSSQFGFHPWLPSAMEGPTPVSALLHSSTMVVAGVFLLVRLSYFGGGEGYGLCLLVGGLTSVFASSVAVYQFDFKKVVAYSTTSQLGLMVGSMGLGCYNLAFFHMCTHAFFKALLFLCSGSVIHSLKNEQDIRKIGGFWRSLPVSFCCFFMSSVALVGVPFFSGFYSKDLILESVMSSSYNFIGIFFLVCSTFLTSCYSFRLVFYCFGGGGLKSMSCMGEEDSSLIFPLIRLLMGVFFFGFFFSYFFNLDFLLPSGGVKISPLIFVTLGVAFGFVIYGWVGSPVLSFYGEMWQYAFLNHWLSSFFISGMSLKFSLYDRVFLSSFPEGVGGLVVSFTKLYVYLFQMMSLKGQLGLLLILVFCSHMFL